MDKQEIIEEIRRTAKENDGKSIGMQRFSKLTGIRRADWYGIHWASWGEAVSEAGFPPRELTKGYDETWLIETFIRIIREVGAWPTEGRLRLIFRNQEEFPNGNTFRARLRNKADMASKILAYCREHQGCDDIVAICEPIVHCGEIAEDSEETGDESFGFVYLMRHGRYHKIGRSNAVGRREYELRIKLPEELVTVHTIKN